MTSNVSLKEISEVIKSLDIAMLTTRNVAGELESRPMSNNKDVDYNGDSYYFTMADTRAVQDIEREAQVNVSFDGRKGLLGKQWYVSVSGTADIIRDRAILEKHWVPDLELWFKDGLDTLGITLIHVRAANIRHWHGMQEGEIRLSSPARAA